MKVASIRRFDGGITNEPRDRENNVAKVITNFDTNSNPFKMSPLRDSENGDSSSSTNLITSFAIAKTSGTSPSDVYNLYGLGSTSNKAKIYYKTIASALSNATWTSTANNESASGTVSPNLFVHYSRSNSGSAVNNSGILFGAKGVGGAGSLIWGYDPTGTTAFGEDWLGVAGEGGDACPTMYRVAQGLVHSKDDVLYIPYDNKIMSNSYASGSSVWTAAALTLPVGGYIPCICEYKNFLAVAHRPIANTGNNYVYLWERDTSLTTLAEKIYWGDESLQYIEEIDGYLVGISLTNTDLRFKNRLVFRVYNGYGAEKVLEITSPTISLPGNATAKQKINNRFYFPANITIDGVARKGVWSFGRNALGQWTLVHERTPNNDTSSTTGTTGFAYLGDYLFQVYDTAMSKTNDQESYTATSIYETVVNPGMASADMSRMKSLTGVSVSCEKLPSGGSIVVKYRTDATTAWSSAATIISESTAGVYVSEQRMDNSGSEFTKGREFEFRIESTGGAEITELKYTYETEESVLPL